MEILENYQQYLSALSALMIEAGAGILDIYYKSTQFEIQSKSDASPLTQADLMSHRTIVNGLRHLTPDIPILSEENPDIPFEERQQWKQYWLVDPLDGTKEFIRHSGDFVINIALIKQQKPVLGLIYSPVLNELYFAATGTGAYKQKIGVSSPQRILTRTWQQKTRVVVGHYYKVEKLKTVLAQFGEYEVMPVGSALKFCIVASGEADLYPRLGNTSEWDTAAGQIIVEEAGGLVVDFDMKPLRYNTKPSLLNPYFIVTGDIKLMKIFEEKLCKK